MASQSTSECLTEGLFRQSPPATTYTYVPCTHARAETQTLTPTHLIAILTCRWQKLWRHMRTLWGSLSNYLLTAEELRKFAEAVFAKAWSAYKTPSKPIKYEIHA